MNLPRRRLSARVLAFSALVFAATAAADEPATLPELTMQRAATCTELGPVAGSNAMFVGLMAKRGSRKAREAAEKQATDLGGDAVLWSQRGTSLTNEWIGVAYACGSAAAAAPAAASPSTTAAPTAAAAPAAAAPAAAPAAAGAPRPAAPVDLGNGIFEVLRVGANCQELGPISGSSKVFVGLMARTGSRRAKEAAVKQAGELGGNTVVWSARGTSLTNEWIGTAYRCD